jgi:hypothetical protein
LKRYLLIAIAAVAASAALPSVASAADLSATPNPVDLGTIATGSLVSATVNVTNVATGPVMVKDVSIVLGPWAVSPSQCYVGRVLSPGQSCILSVTPGTDTPGAVDGQLRVYTGNATSITSSLAVSLHALVETPQALEYASLNRSAFYPLVRDGYRDTVTYSAGFAVPASGRVQVKNSAGRIVRSWAFTDRQNVAVTWNGRNSAGTKVAPGTFRFRVVTPGATGGIRSVAVRTGWKSVSHTVRRSGWNTTSRSGSNCHWHNYSGTLSLDAWSGYCNATWSIRVPSGARNVSAAMRSYLDPYLDFNIGGHVSRSVTRTATGYSFTAHADNYRCLDVSSVRVSYTTRVRI